MFKVLLYIILGVYFLGFIFTLLTIFLEKIYKNKLSKVKVKKYKNIYVLLPALREQKIVNETIDWFKKIKYKGQIKYIVITTEKEEYENKVNNIKEITTSQLVDKKLAKIKDERFMHMHYPEKQGNKSSQMNYAVDEILKIEKDIENTYISVFDFDSKPAVNTFNELNKVAQLRNNPDAINQVPLCFKNYEEFSKDKSKVLLLLYTFQHTIRSCAIEKMKLLVSSLTNMRVPQYFMGACMHIKLKSLIENDKFPIFVDDLTLGYRLSIKNGNFAYLPTYNYTLIPNKVYDYVNSAVLIFKGISTYISEIKRAKGRNYLGKIKMFIAGTGNIVVFTIIPYVIVFYYLYSIVTLQFTLLFWLLLSIPYLWSIASYINLKYEGFKNDNKLTSFIAFLLSPIWFVFRPFGFFVYLKRLIVSKVSKTDIKYKKTER